MDTDVRSIRGRTRAGLALLGLVILGMLGAVLAASPALAATPGQLQLLDTDPEYASVQINQPGGTQVESSPGWFALQVTPTGGTPTTYRGFCVDTEHEIGTGTAYDVSFITAADDPSLASPASGSVAWLLQGADGLIAAAADKNLEAGALQVAVWVLLGEADQNAPTSDAALNARAAELVALATGKGVAGPLTISPAQASTCAGGAGTVLTLTGTPGSVATLGITSGVGTLSATQVTFGATGTAAVTLTSATPGAVSVSVSASGGELTKASRPAGSENQTPQETAFLVPRTYTAATTVNFTNCAAVLVTPVTPTVSGKPKPAAAKPKLTITKTGPARRLAGQRVPYTVTIRNTSSVIARNLVVTDTLPASLAFISSDLAPSSVGKRIVWKLASLRPGKSRTISIVLQSPSTLNGTRTNVVTVVATSVATVRDTAATIFRSVPIRVRPAVTG